MCVKRDERILMEQKPVTDLRLQIPMDVAKLVQSIDGAAHLRNVKFSVLLLEHTRIVEQSSKVASWHIFLQRNHSDKVEM